MSAPEGEEVELLLRNPTKPAKNNELLDAFLETGYAESPRPRNSKSSTTLISIYFF